MKFTRLLARRSAQERQAIAAMRGQLPPRLSALPGADHDFDALAELAQRRQWHLFAPRSPFVSDGEIQLIGRLAAAQRQEVRLSQNDVADDRYRLLRCALLLREAGLWLPLAQTSVGTDATARAPRNAYAGVGGLMRARAISLARSRQVASTSDFIGIGVSRQYVSRLCKDGLLERVRHGWYRAAPPVDRPSR